MKINKKTKTEELLEEKLEDEKLGKTTQKKKKYFSKIRNAIGKRAKQKGSK